MEQPTNTTTYDLDPPGQDIPQVVTTTNARGAQATKRVVARDAALSATRTATGRETVGAVFTQVAETITNNNTFNF